MSLPDDETRNPDDLPASEPSNDDSLEGQPVSESDSDAATSNDRSLDSDAATDESPAADAPLGDDSDFAPVADPDETLDFAAPADMESGIGFQAMGAEDEEQAELPGGDEPLADFAVGTEELAAEKGEDETGELEEEAEKATKKTPTERLQGILAAVGESDPYTVLMGVALVALLLGVFFFYLELSAYNFDIWAERARQLFGTMGLLPF